ncbi:MAG: hypothetical protein RBU30_15555 [Polyangia bacterium]|nr:hypothetical protein [Polyangia bacterium]
MQPHVRDTICRKIARSLTEPRPSSPVAACLLLLAVIALPIMQACQLQDAPDEPTPSKVDLQPVDPPKGRAKASPEPAAPVSVTDGVKYYSSAIQIGDPIRQRFPADSKEHCFIRSIRAMVTHGDKVFVGSGDYWNNSGRTDLWALSDDAGILSWTLDYTVDDEMVDTFRIYDGILYVPGTDATEDWSFGNFYTRVGSSWTKYRTVPNALHVVDIAKFKGDLYVHMWDQKEDMIMRSADQGVTWSRLTRKPIYGRLLGLEDMMLIFGETRRGSLHVYDGVSISKMNYDVFPGGSMAWPNPDRLVPFLGGAVYAAVDFAYAKVSAPLYFLDDFAAGPRQVGTFGKAGGLNVRDLQVVDGLLYVLSVRPDPANIGQYLGAVDVTANLERWLRIADFSVPAPPYSFAILNEAIYVGLGADGWWFDNTAAASGSVWLLTE